MEYMPKGWLFFRFLLTPEELSKVLRPFHLVEFNRHVPVGYRETPREAFLATYRQLYAKLAQGSRLTKGESLPLLHDIGLTTDLSRCPYGREHLYAGERFLSPVFSTPCVGLAPFAMTVCPERRQVSLRGSYLLSPQNIVGYEASYPKQISTLDSSLRSTSALPGYQDFLLLKERVSAISHGLRFELEGQTYRPPVRIGEAAKADFSRFYAVSQFYR